MRRLDVCKIKRRRTITDPAKRPKTFWSKHSVNRFNDEKAWGFEKVGVAFKG